MQLSVCPNNPSVGIQAARGVKIECSEGFNVRKSSETKTCRQEKLDSVVLQDVDVR